MLYRTVIQLIIAITILVQNGCIVTREVWRHDLSEKSEIGKSRIDTEAKLYQGRENCIKFNDTTVLFEHHSQSISKIERIEIWKDLTNNSDSKLCAQCCVVDGDKITIEAYGRSDYYRTKSQSGLTRQWYNESLKDITCITGKVEVVTHSIDQIPYKTTVIGNIGRCVITPLAFAADVIVTPIVLISLAFSPITFL